MKIIFGLSKLEIIEGKVECCFLKGKESDRRTIHQQVLVIRGRNQGRDDRVSLEQRQVRNDYHTF